MVLLAMNRLIAAAVAALLSTGAHALPLTVDFEEFSYAGSLRAWDETVDTQRVRFSIGGDTPDAGDQDWVSYVPAHGLWKGGKALSRNNNQGMVSLSALDGAGFDFLSIDLHETCSRGATPTQIVFTGTKAAGGTVRFTCTTDGFHGWDPVAAADSSDLISVSFAPQNALALDFDNASLEFSVVAAALPAAAPLLPGAPGLAGAPRRRA